MCPFSFDLLDEEKQKAQVQDQGAGAPAMTGGGLSFGAGSPQAQPQQEKGTQKQGSGFVGLDQYMNANKGNKFGNQFTGKVQGSVDAAKQTLNQNADAFSNASNQGATKWNDVQDQVKGIVDSAGDSTTKDDASKVQGLANAKYQGPENFLGTAYGTQAQGGVQKAAQQAKALQSEGGRFALLDQYFGRPQYNQGQKSLDNLLVQSAPGVAARAQNIGTQAKQVSAQAAQKNQELDNLAAANKQATDDAAKQTRDYLGQARTGFETDLNTRYSDYTSANDDYNIARLSDVADDAFDADTMSLLGLNEGDTLYNTNLASYFQDSPNASLGEFASDQDYAKYLALSQLAGDDPTLLKADNRAKAGTGAGLGKLAFDKDRFQSDRNTAQAQYDGQSSALSSQAGQFDQTASVKRAAADRMKDSRDPMERDFARQLYAEADAAMNAANNARSQITSLQNSYGVNRKVRKA